MSFKIGVVGNSIAADLEVFKKEIEQDLTKAIQNLANLTHAKISEMANAELNSTRKTYLDALKFEEVSSGVWVVSLDEKANFIEDGLPSGFDMKPGLLGGRQSRVIPFEHSKGPSQQNPYAQNLTARIKSGMRKQGVPFKKIEKDQNGNPRLGMLHSFDFGGETPGKGNTPVLDRVKVYQTQTKTGSIRRDILTFRTVSSGPASQGKWLHPGMDKKDFFQKAYDWAAKEWETTIVPDIINRWGV